MQSLTFTEKMFILGAAFVLSYMVGLGFGLGAKHSGFYPIRVSMNARGGDNNIHSPNTVVLEGRNDAGGVLEEEDADD